MLIHTTGQGTIGLVDVSQAQFDDMIAYLREECDTRDYDAAWSRGHAPPPHPT